MQPSPVASRLRPASRAASLLLVVNENASRSSARRAAAALEAVRSAAGRVEVRVTRSLVELHDAWPED